MLQKLNCLKSYLKKSLSPLLLRNPLLIYDLKHFHIRLIFHKNLYITMYNVIMVSCNNSYHNIRVRSYLSVLIKSCNIRQTKHTHLLLFICLSLLLHNDNQIFLTLFLELSTFFLASSNSTDMASTLLRVSSILNKPFLNLDTCSPSSSRFSDNNLRKKEESFR